MSQIAHTRPPAQKVRRVESKKYIAWVRDQPSVISGQHGCDPHHIISVGDGRMGSKASDLLTIPLTRTEHNELHHDVRQWESIHGSQWQHVAVTLARYVAEGLG